MAAVNKVFAARLAGLVVLGPDGESIGRVRDVVLTIRIGRQPPRVLGLVIEMFTRKRIFVPMLRVTAIEPASVTLKTGNVSLRRFDQRPTEILALAQVLDSRVRIDDPEVTEAIGTEAVIVDLGIELTRTRDWVVSRVAVRAQRGRLGRRSAIHVVDWQHVHGLTPTALSMPGQGVSQLLMQFEGMRAADVAHAMRELPEKRRHEVALALDDERLADVVQELPADDQTDLLLHLEVERAADVLEAMDPDDAADLLGELPETDAESLLQLMDPEDSEPVRRLLEHSPDTAGGLMTPEPVVLTPSTTVAEALARARNADLTPALASMVFVVRPPTATPTGRYLGCVHLQRLLREPPANLVGGVLDDDLPRLDPEDSLATVTRFFATYNLVCAPVVDDEHHLLGAVTVDDVLDHLLPTDWREEDHNHE
ncbi:MULTISPECIES: magnesium transporter MgtE N-terminal domain-containing protein [Prescottella]|jgi:Mg/Co/Ni transporter MgtE|uniref:MgtE intracellular domain protein n=2 Tax=Rhodococcus hoagii TaxID=43767 RepID=F1TJH1_RHOHA|nr:CBS domain-containing protein [Prescottella equi]MBU4616395.1 magnesium transporter [Rhodococcus sp. GG48]MCD7049124.1 CBS domain-containing protein [Rhodococcus sp. BH2-1]GBF13851.1 magnesium transporter MgtE [Rhodococcus sp. Br-6]AVP67922.1 magnesium transporter [Prescottella equi]EGD22275.1 MgtE intracellular domain protein [Prescottella equi ATCC 33707]